MEHCCNEMNLFVEDPRDPIKYHVISRTYYIDCNASNILTMEYCPWCGKKLLKKLSDKFIPKSLNKHKPLRFQNRY